MIASLSCDQKNWTNIEMASLKHTIYRLLALILLKSFYWGQWCKYVGNVRKLPPPPPQFIHFHLPIKLVASSRQIIIKMPLLSPLGGGLCLEGRLIFAVVAWTA
jgi:hypothetical protein